MKNQEIIQLAQRLLQLLQEEEEAGIEEFKSFFPNTEAACMEEVEQALMKILAAAQQEKGKGQ